jgi:DNA-binding CsgD family transcriptional regulator/KaiC/GvpD/RAD55 family RecA-like ATPase
MVEINKNNTGQINRLIISNWVGRAWEIAEAKAIWQNVLRGEGQVLLITGEAGVGKTRFVHQFTSAIHSSGVRILAGECHAQGSAPYAPVTSMIAGIIDNSPQSFNTLSQEIINDLLPIIPSMAQYSDVHPQDPNSEICLEQQKVIEAFFRLCINLSSNTPLLLFIDDAHWADPDTLMLIMNLARRLRERPVLIAITYREAELESAPNLKEILLDFNHERLSSQLNLKRLTASETCDLLVSIFDEHVTGDISEGIFHQTEGNPFFIEEVCKTLVESGQFTYENGHWQYPLVAKILIPQTIRSAIQSRLEKLPTKAQDILRIAAILGMDFEFELLKHASSMDEDSLIGALESSLRAQLITEIQTTHGKASRFKFVHNLIPTTLRESIIHVRRQRLHQHAAEAIEQIYPDNYELLAYQYAEAGDTERAVEYYIRAGDRARQVAPGEAARSYQAALDHWSGTDQDARAEILAHLGYCLWVIDDIEQSLKCYQTAYSIFNISGKTSRSGEMQRMIARLYWQKADFDMAFQHYQQALAIQEHGPETLELAHAIDSMSQIYMLAHDNAQAIVWGKRALNMAKKLGATNVVVSSMNNIGSSHAQSGDFTTGLPIIQKSLQLALAKNLPQEVCRAYFNLGVMYQRQCRYQNAIDVMEKLYTHSSQFHSKTYTILSTLRLVWLNWYTGHWDTALNYHTQLLTTKDIIASTWEKRLIAMMELDMGRAADAIQSLNESLPAAVRADDYQTTVPHWGQLARAYAANGEKDKMLGAIDQILEFISMKGYDSIEAVMPLLISCQLTVFEGSSSAIELAHRSLASLERLAIQFHTEEADAALAEARGLVQKTEHTPVEAVEHFRQSIVNWKLIHRYYDQARALHQLAHTLTDSGDTLEAKRIIQRALTIIELLSNQLSGDYRAAFMASPIVLDIQQSLYALGESKITAQPSKIITQLTIREVEVLKLVSEGLTNAQIANQLVLSTLTINAHLRSIFNKLDVRTRTAAAHRALEIGLL